MQTPLSQLRRVSGMQEMLAGRGWRWKAAPLMLCSIALLAASMIILHQQERPNELENRRYRGNDRVTRVPGVKVPMGVATTVEDGPVAARRRDARVARRVYKTYPPREEKRSHSIRYDPYDPAVQSRNVGANTKLRQSAKTQDLSDDSIDSELEKVLGADEAAVVKKSAANHDISSDMDLDRMQHELDHLKAKSHHRARSKHQQLHHNFEASYDAFEYPKKSDVGKSFVTGADNIQSQGSGYPINGAASDADAPLFTTEDVTYQSPAAIVPAPGSSFHVHPGLWLPHVEGPDWDYTGDKHGPYNWGNLKQAWEVCDNGFNQSPINIELNVKRNEELEPLRWFGPTHPYEATLVSPLYKNVITIENLKGHMMAGGVQMHLRSATIHTPSEHKFQGKHMDGEIQFLHTANVGGNDVQLIVSAFLTVSGGTAPALRTTMAAVKTFLGTYFVDKKGQYSYLGPLYQMDVKPSFWFSISEIAEDLLGSGANYANYYTYYGSLTAPPCSEGVTWILLKQPIAISPNDHADLLSLQGHTARPIQAMGGREVYDTATGRSPGMESPIHNW